jgi:hypothetical protein
MAKIKKAQFGAPIRKGGSRGGSSCAATTSSFERAERREGRQVERDYNKLMRQNKREERKAERAERKAPKAQDGDTTKVLKPKGRTDMAGGDLFDRSRREKSIRSMSKNIDSARRSEMMMKSLEKPRKSSVNKVGGMKLGGKVKKAQAGLKASNKRVGPVDPKGAWTTVQKQTIAGKKTPVSLKKDKQLGATKMMKSGGKAKKKK